MSNSNREELQAFSKIVKATQGADFGPALQSSLSRRRFFIAGGATISFGALLAACGGTTDTGIARIGDSPEKTELVDAPVTDIALLRTATSLNTMRSSSTKLLLPLDCYLAMPQRWLLDS